MSRALAPAIYSHCSNGTLDAEEIEILKDFIEQEKKILQMA